MWFKTIEQSRVESGRGRLKSFTKSSNVVGFFAGKILVFWIGGRLLEVLAHGGSTVARETC